VDPTDLAFAGLARRAAAFATNAVDGPARADAEVVLPGFIRPPLA